MYCARMKRDGVSLRKVRVGGRDYQKVLIAQGAYSTLSIKCLRHAVL